MAYHNELGKWGEDVAAWYLQQKGYAIIARNWRSGHYEIDIIARQPNSNVWVFVEVKTRSHEDFQSPEEAVDMRKAYFWARASLAFMRKYQYSGDVRYDMIAVIPDPDRHDPPTIRHTEGFFTPNTTFYGYSPYRKRRFP